MATDSFGIGKMLKPLMGIMMIGAILPLIGDIIPKPKFTLTYTAGANGTITGTSPQTVTTGTDGSAVLAVADSGYHFEHWSDGSMVNPRTDTNVTANISVTATFVNTFTCPIDGIQFATLALLQAHFASAHPTTPIDIIWS